MVRRLLTGVPTTAPLHSGLPGAPMILMILRHGKAENGSPTGRDVDRVLAPRGQRQADFIAKMLAAGWGLTDRGPAAVISSRAARARATAEPVARALGLEVTFEDALIVGTSVREAQSLVRRLLKKDEPVVLVGHNPQLEELVSSLTSGEDDLRTGELVCVRLESMGKVLRGREEGRLRWDDEDD